MRNYNVQIVLSEHDWTLDGSTDSSTEKETTTQAADSQLEALWKAVAHFIAMHADAGTELKSINVDYHKAPGWRSNPMPFDDYITLQAADGETSDYVTFRVK